MRVKRFLILVLTISAIVYLFYLVRVNEKIHSIYTLAGDSRFWLYAIASFALILSGHIIRSYKFKRLLDPVKKSGLRTQFQSLLIGYLFNTVLPLRLGEVVRAIVLGR